MKKIFFNILTRIFFTLPAEIFLCPVRSDCVLEDSSVLVIKEGFSCHQLQYCISLFCTELFPVEELKAVSYCFLINLFIIKGFLPSLQTYIIYEVLVFFKWLPELSTSFFCFFPLSLLCCWRNILAVWDSSVVLCYQSSSLFRHNVFHLLAHTSGVHKSLFWCSRPE